MSKAEKRPRLAIRQAQEADAWDFSLLALLRAAGSWVQIPPLQPETILPQ